MRGPDTREPPAGPGHALTSLLRRVWTLHLWGQDTTTHGHSVSSCFWRRERKCRQLRNTQPVLQSPQTSPPGPKGSPLLTAIVPWCRSTHVMPGWVLLLKKSEC